MIGVVHTIQGSDEIVQVGLYCDICKLEIANAKEGAAVYNNFPTEGQVGEVLHVHKDIGRTGKKCQIQAEISLQLNGQIPGWEELTTFFKRLQSRINF